MKKGSSRSSDRTPLRILGVDPGTLVTGYGVVDLLGSTSTYICSGIIKTGSKVAMPLRLRTIHLGLMEVIEEYAPDEFAIESAFYAKNVQSTLKLGHARGVSILAAALREIPTAEYAPREMKQAVVGNGNATKEQVAYMVRSTLRLPDDAEISLDASDALGVALTHAFRIRSGGPVVNKKRGKKKSWEDYVRENPERVKNASAEESKKRGEQS